MRTSPLVRHRPIQGESNIDFLGESEGSLPQPQDSFPDAGEAINDFWSMSGNFIYRHHVEPRVNLYSPREEKITKWECLLIHREKGLFLLVYVDDIKLARKKQNIDQMWNVLKKEVDLGEPTSFLDHVYLGCTQ